MNFRTGIGYDVHKLVPGRKLILGGIHIPYELGLEGHSDADVVLHAICDAILGAAACGDIGEHFPNSDIRFKGISSLILLSKVNEMVNKKYFTVVNVDVAVLAEEPKLSVYKPQMKSNIARVLNIDIDEVNIKATTNEGLGFVGKKEGIAAYAAVLLEKSL